MEYQWHWYFSAQYQSWEWWHTLILNIMFSRKHWPTCPFLAASTLLFLTPLTCLFFLLHNLSEAEQEKMMYILLITVSFTVQGMGSFFIYCVGRWWCGREARKPSITLTVIHYLCARGSKGEKDEHWLKPEREQTWSHLLISFISAFNFFYTPIRSLERC